MEGPRKFDVQGIGIGAPFEVVFDYISEIEDLPKWTKAFKSAGGGRALLSTPNGELDIGLRVDSDKGRGTIDWHMEMPDGSVASAYSRVTRDGDGSVFTFVLMAPPVPIEQVEGALEQQIGLLREEMGNLKRILEA